MVKREKATRQVLEHVQRARAALDDFRGDGISAEGELTRPLFQNAPLKVAREELAKAIAIIDRTTWNLGRRCSCGVPAQWAQRWARRGADAKARSESARDRAVTSDAERWDEATMNRSDEGRFSFWCWRPPLTRRRAVVNRALGLGLPASVPGADCNTRIAARNLARKRSVIHLRYGRHS